MDLMLKFQQGTDSHKHCIKALLCSFWKILYLSSRLIHFLWVVRQDADCALSHSPLRHAKRQSNLRCQLSAASFAAFLFSFLVKICTGLCFNRSYHQCNLDLHHQLWCKILVDEKWEKLVPIWKNAACYQCDALEGQRPKNYVEFM